MPWFENSPNPLPPLTPAALLGSGRKHNLFTHVVEELGARIVRGELSSGETFPSETDLGREFSASRSVIREAVKSLAAKGLLESRTRTGIRVLPPIYWNLLDMQVLDWRYSSMRPGDFFRELFEIRRMIEPAAARMAAERATQTEIDRIAAAYAVMESSDKTTDAAILADLAFHREILSAGGNALLPQMAKLIGVGLLVSYRISKDPFTVFLRQHRDVLTAIRKRRPVAADRAMDTLLTGTYGFLRTRIDQGPDATSGTTPHPS